LEDSDVLGDETPEDNALVKSMRRRKINEDLMATAESSPSGCDDDADAAASPALSREMSAPQVTKGSTRLFAEEDDLESILYVFPLYLNYFYLYSKISIWLKFMSILVQFRG
jgi:hypothetical protein